jgi:hypothetical protein
MTIVATCIGCGCTDDHACPGGCAWLRVDYEEGLGVCSQCGEHEAAWDAAHPNPLTEGSTA